MSFGGRSSVLMVLRVREFGILRLWAVVLIPMNPTGKKVMSQQVHPPTSLFESNRLQHTIWILVFVVVCFQTLFVLKFPRPSIDNNYRCNFNGWTLLFLK